MGFDRGQQVNSSLHWSGFVATKIELAQRDFWIGQPTCKILLLWFLNYSNFVRVKVQVFMKNLLNSLRAWTCQIADRLNVCRYLRHTDRHSCCSCSESRVSNPQSTVFNVELAHEEELENVIETAAAVLIPKSLFLENVSTANARW